VIPLWQLLCPRYGNFGGPGWSGGRFVDDYRLTDWSVPATDSMDELFKRHDLAYQDAIREYDRERLTDRAKAFEWEIADCALVAGLEALSPRVDEWKYRPTSRVYARLFRLVAMYAFRAKVALM
jgi:hypothetical protein